MAKLEVIKPKQNKTGIPDSMLPHSEYDRILPSGKDMRFLVYFGFRISLVRASLPTLGLFMVGVYVCESVSCKKRLQAGVLSAELCPRITVHCDRDNGMLFDTVVVCV